jgi:hypothetical protein
MLKLLRAVLLIAVCVLAADDLFGHGRLIAILSDQTVQLVHKLNEELTKIVHLISPYFH